VIKSNVRFIYWFAYYNLDSPSVRYRGYYPLNYFKARYHIDSFFVIPGYSIKCIFNFIRAYLSALLFRKPDSLIVIQRVQSDFIYSGLLKVLIRLRKNNTIYDIDDADYLEKNPATIYYFASHCEWVSAGSPAIANHLKQFNPRILHITSPVPDLGIVKKKRNSKFTIGWIGGFGSGHKESLVQSVFPAIQAMPFEVRFVLMGVQSHSDINFIRSFFEPFPNIQIEMPQDIDWLDESSVQTRVTEFDIGIATLSDTPVHRAKSGIKAKQYLNNGIPVLSTDLPENNSVIIDGKNGLLCSGPDEFKSGLIRFYLMSDQEYAQFAANARQSVSNFDHDRFLNDFAITVKGISKTPLEKII